MRVRVDLARLLRYARQGKAVSVCTEVAQRQTGRKSAVKKIEAIIKPFKLDEVKEALHEVGLRSEEHTSELQSLMRISYAVFCLIKKKTTTKVSQQILNR